MSGAPPSGPPRGPRERVAAPGPADPARPPGKGVAAKPAPGRPADGHPGVDFTAALVVAGSVPPPLPLPTLPRAAPVPGAEPLGAAPVRARPDAERPEALATRAPLELKLPDELSAGRVAPAAGEPATAAPSSTPASAPHPALEDRNLAGAVLPAAAHLVLDAGQSGEIGLHLRVRDGVADLRIDGSVAPLVEARSAELRLALAREGLQLHSLELSGGAGDSSHHGAPDRPETPEGGPAPVAPAPATAGAVGPPPAPRGATAAAPGRIHVEA